MAPIGSHRLTILVPYFWPPPQAVLVINSTGPALACPDDRTVRGCCHGAPLLYLGGTGEPQFVVLANSLLANSPVPILQFVVLANSPVPILHGPELCGWLQCAVA